MNREIRRACLATAFISCASIVAGAQDTSRVVVDSAGDTVILERKPPISAKRAFISSAILPGLGQSKLGRPRSGAMMLAVEAMSVAMIRESALGVREARRNATDSVIVSYVDATGAPGVTYARTGYPAGLVKTRKEHVEDWVALLVANHLFSAVDALVAALLWDLPAEVAIDGGQRSTSFGLRFRF